MQLAFTTGDECRDFRASLLKVPPGERNRDMVEHLSRCDVKSVQMALPVHATFLTESGTVVRADFASISACEAGMRNVADRIQIACASR